jgi:hypothetical protein
MSDSDQPLSPEEEEVRRLLAEARHTGPTPPEVVARLDRALDDLALEPTRVTPGVDLARRRRRAAALLVAAAVVGVVGIGVGQVISTQSGSDTSTAGASRQQEDAGSDSVKPKSGGSFASGAEPNDAPAQVPVAPQDSQEKSALAELRRDHLTDDLVKLRRLDLAPRQPLTDEYRAGAPSADRAAGAACGASSWGRGRFVPVSFSGTPAVLVLRRPVGDTQVADLFLCGSQEPVRSVTLPAP